jgi:hypothetical protein
VNVWMAFLGAVAFGLLYLVGFLNRVAIARCPKEERAEATAPGNYRFTQRLYAVTTAGFAAYFVAKSIGWV